MKKLLCLSLSLIIIICSVFAVDLSAYAVNSKESGINTLYINPFLNDDKDEILEELNEINELGEQPQEETQNVSTYSSLRFASYPTAEQAADTLRDAMVNRKNTITVKFISGTISTEAAVLAVFNRAIDQSNSISAQDGDYLHWHIAAAGYNATSSVVDNKYLYTVTYRTVFLTTALQEERVTCKINEINKRLNLAGKSDYVKALEIHDTVCDFIRYDYDYIYDLEITGRENLIKHSAYGGLFSGLAVCQSYATLYYRLCYENGLKSRVVTSIDHAWNIVNVYGKNYFVDCTWDDGFYDDPEDANGNYWADVYDYYYFLYGSEDEERTDGHILENQYAKPSFTNTYPIEAHGLIEDACPHEVSQNVAPADTYCGSGFTGKIYCRVCLYPLGTYTVPKNSEHSYISEVIEPNCTSKGYTHHKCEFCPYSYDDAYIAASGHNYKNRIKAATLTANGQLTPVCTKCKAAKNPITVYSVKTFSLSTTTYAYNGKAKTPAVTVKDSRGKVLKKNTDYTVTYQSGRTKIGKYKVTVKLKGNYSGTKNLYFTISPRISLSGTNYTYNGKVKKPAVTVKDGNGNKISTKYYTVAYASGRKNVGKYKVTIKFRNGHSGTYTKYFTIKPTATSISSVSPTKRAFTVRWRKKTAQVTGYQIQYSVKSNFSTYKTVRITKNSTTSRKISKLASKRRYYVRVRTYKTVGKTNYYSDWSSKKSVVTK